MQFWKKATILTIVVIGLLTAVSAAFGGADFGRQREYALSHSSLTQFGITHPLARSSSLAYSPSIGDSHPASLATFASSLRSRVITAGLAGGAIDMMALWPNGEAPEYLIACNEEGTTEPGVQRIHIATGVVETIVTGTDSCDGVRLTSWGTVLFSEEAGGGPTGGRAYELLDPVHTTDVMLDRTTGEFTGGSGSANLTARPALGRLSFEGFALYPNGLMYYGDENRPSNGTAGGAYFKFVPSTLWTSGDEAITSLSESPFASGSIYGLRVGRRNGYTDYGQGTQYGFGQWVPVCTADTSDSVAACSDPDLRALAATLKLTGYYRPEDIDIDGRALKAGLVHFCAPNTGNEGDDQFYGEVICLSDGPIASAPGNDTTPEVQLLVAGNPELAMPDNIAYHPGRDTWLVHEDADTLYPSESSPDNNDLWECLSDGADADLQSDGCVRIATLNDPTAEWTGGIFDASGSKFFVSLQHNISGKGIVLLVTGWR